MDPDFEARLAAQIVGEGLAAKAEGHLMDAKAAKRVRPRFLFACGSLLGVPSKKLLDAACAVELIHTATLVHDDIIDKAATRRERPSVNAAFGNGVAVLAGDALLARAMMLLTNGPHASAVLEATTLAFLQLVESCVLEIELSGKPAIPREVLLGIADGKTGALFALCGNLAGIFAVDHAASERLTKAGTLLGRAFQLKDDIEDVEEDAANRIPTLPQRTTTKDALAEATVAIDQALSLLKPYENRAAYPPLIATIRQLARM